MRDWGAPPPGLYQLLEIIREKREEKKRKEEKRKEEKREEKRRKEGRRKTKKFCVKENEHAHSHTQDN
jgi:hypothetical protein